MLIDADKLFDRLMEEWMKNDLPEEWARENPQYADIYQIGKNAGIQKALEILKEMRNEALKEKLDKMFTP